MNRLPVAAICDDFPLRALLVAPDSDLEQILEQSLNQTQERSAIFLIKKDGSLAGIIDPTEMLLWGQIHLGLLPIPKKLTDRKLWRVTRAQTAKDLALPNSHELKISAQTSIADAIKKLMAFNQEVIAIVDEQNRVFNDLYIYELMAYAVRHTKGNIHA